MRVEHDQYPSYPPQGPQSLPQQHHQQPWGTSTTELPREDYAPLQDHQQGYYQQSTANVPVVRSRPQPAPKPWGPPASASTAPAVTTPTTQSNYQQIMHGTPNPSTNNNTMNISNLPDSTAKVNRLSEMGFPRDKVQQALLANSGDENAALNSLLAGDAVIIP